MKGHDFAIDRDIDAYTRANPPCRECGEELTFAECKAGICDVCIDAPGERTCELTGQLTALRGAAASGEYQATGASLPDAKREEDFENVIDY